MEHIKWSTWQDNIPEACQVLVKGKKNDNSKFYAVVEKIYSPTLRQEVLCISNTLTILHKDIYNIEYYSLLT